MSRPQVPASLSWLDLGPRAEAGEVTLYAAHEATGEVSRLQLAADLGTVTTLETVQLPGAGPAHGERTTQGRAQRLSHHTDQGPDFSMTQSQCDEPEDGRIHDQRQRRDD